MALVEIQSRDLINPIPIGMGFERPYRFSNYDDTMKNTCITVGFMREFVKCYSGYVEEKIFFHR